jgi:hypothetical protein
MSTTHLTKLSGAERKASNHVCSTMHAGGPEAERVVTRSWLGAQGWYVNACRCVWRMCVRCVWALV